MSAPTEPVALLREAARLVREHATTATPGPWTTQAFRVGGYVVIEGVDQERVADTMHGDCQVNDARWIALMSPAIAEPLAAWLDEAASQVEYLPPRRHSAQALAVARAIVKAAQR